MIQSGVVAATFALAANAFIIPSTVSLPHFKGDGLAALKNLNFADKLSGAAHIVSGERLVKVDCPGCSFEGDEDQQTENAMVFKWTFTDDRQTLVLNGADFYNDEAGLLSGHEFPTSQVPARTTIDALRNDFETYATSPRPLGYNAGSSVKPATDGTKEELISLDFSVTRLDKEQVHGAASLNIRLLKDETGRLAISDIVAVPAAQPPTEADQPATTPAPPKEAEAADEKDKTFSILPVSPMIKSAPNGAAPSCEGHTEAFCNFMEMFKTRVARIHNAIQAAKAAHFAKLNGSVRHPCHGKMASPGQATHHRGPFRLHFKGHVRKIKLWIIRITHNRPQQSEGAPQDKAQVEAQPHHDHPHIQHAPLHGIHRITHVAHNVFFGFFIPVLIGIAAGMTASLLGMVVGTCIAMLWFKIRRGGRRGNVSGTTMEGAKGEVALGEEKMGLMHERDSAEFQEAPPMYEDKE